MPFKTYFNKAVRAFNLRNLVIFVMPVSIAVLIIMLFNFSQTVEHLSHELIKRTINKTQMELTEFFDPVKSNLLVTKDLGLGGSYQNLDVQQLNPQFIPYLKNSSQVSSMLIANTSGEEFMLLEEDSTWQNRLTKNTEVGKEVMRYRWSYDAYLEGIMLSEWKKPEDVGNNPLTKTWFLEAIKSGNSQLPAWTAPYSFKTTKEPGITASIMWKSKEDSNLFVAAFDVLLTDISRYTTRLEISKNGKAVVFTKDLKIIGLPSDIRFNSIDSIKKYVLKTYDSLQLPVFETAINQWIKKERQTDKPFHFKDDDGLWWCGIEKFSLNASQSFYIAVIVPEADFLAEVNRTRIVIIAGFMLVIILTLLVIKGYNQKRRDNELLQQQKLEIERQRDEIEKQRDIVTTQKDHIDKMHTELKSSIHYAQKIQQAVLPDSRFLSEILPKHFVLYRPHSIVSGDFYWASENAEKQVFTAADCTGHGVPGAFMSMLGVSFLNDIFKTHPTANSGQILDLLRKDVIDALKQKTETDSENFGMGLKDGMDISLCLLHKKDLKLEFSGANNPLYIVRDRIINGQLCEDIHPDLSIADLDLYEIKADKMPIAIYDCIKPFNTNYLQLKTGDKLYMFSDGFPDQFGGEKGKKFMSRPFKRLVLETSKLSLSEQRSAMEKAFIQWISFADSDGQPFHQTDDVLVFCVEI